MESAKGRKVSAIWEIERLSCVSATKSFFFMQCEAVKRGELSSLHNK
jgi:hypothetical protein